MGHLWLTGISIYDLMGGTFVTKWAGHLSINGWGSNGKLLFCLEICSKNAGLQGSTLSDHRMTAGFGPFELPTCGHYREGGTTPNLRLVLFEESSFRLAFTAL